MTATGKCFHLQGMWRSSKTLGTMSWEPSKNSVTRGHPHPARFMSLALHDGAATRTRQRVRLSGPRHSSPSAP